MLNGEKIFWDFYWKCPMPKEEIKLNKEETKLAREYGNELCHKLFLEKRPFAQEDYNIFEVYDLILIHEQDLEEFEG